MVRNRKIKKNKKNLACTDDRQMYIAGSGSVLHGPGHPGGRDQHWILQYQVRNFSGDSEILHEIFRDTTRISLCFSDFRVVSRDTTRNSS